MPHTARLRRPPLLLLLHYLSCSMAAKLREDGGKWPLQSARNRRRLPGSASDAQLVAAGGRKPTAATLRIHAPPAAYRSARTLYRLAVVAAAAAEPDASLLEGPPPYHPTAAAAAAPPLGPSLPGS